jgi:hypothetical protein
MNVSLFLMIFSLVLMLSGLGIFLHFVFFSKLFFSKKEGLSLEKASTFGDFMNGLTSPIFTLAGFLIIYATIIDQKDINQVQNFESVFFTQLEFHRENCRQMTINKSPKSCESKTGYATFVNFQYQYSKAYKIIDTCRVTRSYSLHDKKDLGFALFYLGASDSVILRNFFKRNYRELIPKFGYFFNCLKKIDHCPELKSYFDGNKARLNSFFNQFFAAIELVDQSSFLSHSQKQSYIRMITAQNGYYEANIIHYYIQSSISEKPHKRFYKRYNLVKWINHDLLPYLR